MNRTALAAAGALALLVAGAATAANANSGKDVKAGTYQVDPRHTQIVFSVSHFGLSHFDGIVAGASGSLTLDPAKPAASKLDVEVATDTLYTPVEKLTGELKDANWLDAEKFPKAHFVSTKIVQTGRDDAVIEGQLTLHGVTKPLTLHAHLVGAGVNPIDNAYTVGFEGKGVIKRTDFGIKTYAPMIGDNVNVTINAAFELQK